MPIFFSYMYEDPIIPQQHERFVCSSCLASNKDFYMVPLILQTFCLGPQSLFQCLMRGNNTGNLRRNTEKKERTKKGPSSRDLL